MRWGILLAVIALTGCDQMAENQMQDINNKVAADAEAQYELADKHGTAIDKCVQAGLASAAYLQAQNEDKYRHWKAIEGLACVNAGVLQ